MSHHQEDTISIDRRFFVEVLGEKGVGKTSLVRCFATECQSEGIPYSNYMDVWECVIAVRRKYVRVNILDRTFQESIRNMCWKTSRRSDAIMIVFDCTDRNTFLNLEQWIDHIKEATDTKLVCVVSAKRDVKDRAVSVQEVHEFSDKFGLPAFETSAQWNTGITDMFLTMIQAFLDNPSSQYSGFTLAGRPSPRLFGSCTCPCYKPRSWSRPATCKAIKCSSAEGNSREDVSYVVAEDDPVAGRCSAGTEEDNQKQNVTFTVHKEDSAAGRLRIGTEENK